MGDVAQGPSPDAQTAATTGSDRGSGDVRHRVRRRPSGRASPAPVLVTSMVDSSALWKRRGRDRRGRPPLLRERRPPRLRDRPGRERSAPGRSKRSPPRTSTSSSSRRRRECRTPRPPPSPSTAALMADERQVFYVVEPPAARTPPTLPAGRARSAAAEAPPSSSRRCGCGCRRASGTPRPRRRLPESLPGPTSRAAFGSPPPGNVVPASCPRRPARPGNRRRPGAGCRQPDPVPTGPRDQAVVGTDASRHRHRVEVRQRAAVRRLPRTEHSPGPAVGRLRAEPASSVDAGSARPRGRSSRASTARAPSLRRNRKGRSSSAATERR